jgi:hypothetical protein
MDATWRTRLLIAAAVVVTVVVVIVAVRLLGDRDEPAAAPTPVPSASTASETATTTPPLRPFEVTLRSVKDQPMDGGNMYGRKPDVNGPLTRRAAREAVAFLERYLNTMFVRPQTRSKPEGLQTLLTSRARQLLDKQDRTSLGVGGPMIVGGSRQRAHARVVVLHEGKRVSHMTVEFRAGMRVINGAGRQTEMAQRGVFVLARVGKGWRIDMLDVAYTPPESGPAPQPEPTASDATGASETTTEEVAS